MSIGLFPRSRLERCLALASLALGLLHAWLGRYAMDPDGMSYLDVGQSFFRRDWANAINAWWSPLYPWTVGLFLGIIKPSPRWEFPIARVVDGAIFILALLSFQYLLHAVIASSRERASEATTGLEPLPEWIMVLLGYPIFLWIALEVQTPWDMTPDLAVVACLCLAAGMLLRLRASDVPARFALFGIVLGLGYWTKAILFPLGLVALATAYWWKRSAPGWGRRMLVAALFFSFISASLIFMLSHQKGRITFGDSGKFNYAWYVSPRTFWRNWQGKEAGSGAPVHPTQQLLQHPPVFAFDGPVAGTYPPWTDPSYWNEGLEWHFKLKPQMQVLASTIRSELRLLLRARPDLVLGVIALVLITGWIWVAAWAEFWPLIVISIVGLGLYLPLVENDRYLGGFVLILFLTCLGAVRIRPESQSVVAKITLAMFFTMMLATADYTVRVATHHLAIPGSGPNSTVQDVALAEYLGQIGLQPGDKVAVTLDGTGAYWAHLAKLHIVAEIMDTGHGSREFWSSSADVQRQVYSSFAGAHAKLAVASCPTDWPIPAGWEQVNGTPYCLYRLHETSR